MPTATGPAEDPLWEFPRLRASLFFEDDFKYVTSDQEADTEFFDVKFYPYNPPGGSTIFAAVSKKHVVICRLVHHNEKIPCEIIQVIRDDDDGAVNCACCWSKEAGTNHALICIAGRDAKIKVYRVKDASLYATLVGHGGEINDLNTSPADARIIASASDDTTVRIWSLDPVHQQQPCVCVLGGEGHSWHLLGVTFHETGRYVLSAGHDQVICLWVLPDVPKQHVDVPVVVHYPHFSTSEVHSGLVDCAIFFGDLILSRACHDEVIVLWRIEGFCSADPPPPPSRAPTTFDPSQLTRSGFAPKSSLLCPSPYTRLLQFSTPGCGVQFFMRFSVYHAPGQHAILAFCNAASKIYFWDLERLADYAEFVSKVQDPTRDRSVSIDSLRPPWLKPIQHRKADGPGAKEEALGAGGAEVGDSKESASKILLKHYSPETVTSWEAKYSSFNPHGLVKPHKEELVNKYNKERKRVAYSFVGRQVAWSPSGEWCVVVGSQNLAVILQRWAPERDKASISGAAG